MEKLYMDGWCQNVFKTYEDAEKSAVDHCRRNQTDVMIWEVRAVARYPFPAVTVEAVSESVQKEGDSN